MEKLEGRGADPPPEISQSGLLPEKEFSRAVMKTVNIDGKEYIEKPTEGLPFTNMCQYCDFYGTDCYNRDDFSCHSDERPDGMEVVFVGEIETAHQVNQ